MATDSKIFEDVVAEFKTSPLLHHTQLSLDVREGIVTIAGRVNSFAERRAVERAAKRVAGVKTLILEIRAAAIPIMATNTIADSGATAPGSTLLEEKSPRA